jgi:hypothetical protein
MTDVEVIKFLKDRESLSDEIRLRRPPNFYNTMRNTNISNYPGAKSSASASRKFERRYNVSMMPWVEDSDAEADPDTGIRPLVRLTWTVWAHKVSLVPV